MAAVFDGERKKGGFIIRLLRWALFLGGIGTILVAIVGIVAWGVFAKDVPDFDVHGISMTECQCTAYACPCRSNGHPDHGSCDAADFTYIRFHGFGAPYGGNYQQDALRKWADRIEAWRQQLSAIFVYFNNDAHGYAISNAQTLRGMLGSQSVFRPAPPSVAA